MQEISKYTELAMNHQWIALARLWIENNAPCSREKMFIELGMLMPDTIRFHAGGIAAKHALVREAYRRIFGTLTIPDEIQAPPAKASCKGYTKEILQAAKEKAVRPGDFPHIKRAATLMSNLRKRGVIKKNDDGSYQVF